MHFSAGQLLKNLFQQSWRKEHHLLTAKFIYVEKRQQIKIILTWLVMVEKPLYKKNRLAFRLALIIVAILSV